MLQPVERNGSSPQSNISLKALEIFLTVVDSGSMNAASDVLQSRQPAISLAITNLEQTLGVKLFDRSVRPAVLTWAGKVALKYARDVVTGVHSLEDATRTSGTGPLPVLRVGMLDSFATTIGAPLMTELRDLALEWTVVSGYRPTHVQALVDRSIDVVITPDNVPDSSDFFHKTLFRESYMIAVPASWKGSADFQKLATRDFIRFGTDSYTSVAVARYCEQHGMQLSNRFLLNTMDAVLSMVAAGFGWTFVTPLVFLKSKCDLSTIRLIRLPIRPLERSVNVVMLRNDRTDIAEKIHASSLNIIRKQIKPQLRAIAPWVAGEIVPVE